MAQNPAAQAIAPSSAPTCPGCAKAVDPLRAGHVAIYDGLFLYYCDATCKVAHLRLIAAHLGDEVATLDPPAVAARMASMAPISGEQARLVSSAPGARESGRAPVVSDVLPAIMRDGARSSAPPIASEATRSSAPPAASSVVDVVSVSSAPPRTLTSAEIAEELAEPVRSVPSVAVTSAPVSKTLAKNGANGDASAPRSASPPSFPPASVRPPAASVSSVAASVPMSVPMSVRAAPSVPPPTLRSPPTSGVESVRREDDARGDGVARTAAIAGLVAGMLVPALSLAGDVATVARVPLVVIAAVALNARVVLAPRDPADASPLVIALPVTGAALSAVAAAVLGAPHAVGIAWFAALAAAGAILAEM